MYKLNKAFDDCLNWHYADSEQGLLLLVYWRFSYWKVYGTLRKPGFNFLLRYKACWVTDLGLISKPNLPHRKDGQKDR